MSTVRLTPGFTRQRLLVAAVTSAVVLLAFGAALLAAPSAGAGGQAGFSCPNGFDIGAVTLDEYLQLPKVQAGIPVLGVQRYIDFFNAIDKNGNGVTCQKTTAASDNSNDQPKNDFHLYFYNAVDDNSSANTG